MRITILLLIIREEQEFLCKYLIFRKFDLKMLKNNILKISLHFHSTVYNEGGVGILFKHKFFRKFALNFLKNIFLKISLRFLVKDGNPFHLKCELFFYCQ